MSRRRRAQAHATYDVAGLGRSVRSATCRRTHDEAAVEELRADEKAAALEELFAARFSLLLGPAGTGKTRLLQMLCDLPEVRGDGVLLLAPTGKARVQMQRNIEGLKALTIAQFLLPDRFDPETQQYHLSKAPKVESGWDGDHRRSFDGHGGHARRGDRCAEGPEADHPGRRPPTAPSDRRGAAARRPREGAPAMGRRSRALFPRVGPGYAELTVHRRQTGKGKRAATTCFWLVVQRRSARSRRRRDLGADGSWRDRRPCRSAHLADGRRPKGPLLEALVQHVPEIETRRGRTRLRRLAGRRASRKGVFFNAAWPEKNRPGSSERCESWQVLTPVRGKGHGVEELNRFLHERFRPKRCGLRKGAGHAPHDRMEPSGSSTATR